jgi:hypothetical protein
MGCHGDGTGPEIHKDGSARTKGELGGAISVSIIE